MTIEQQQWAEGDEPGTGWIGSQLALYQFSVHLCSKLPVRRENDKGLKTPREQSLAALFGPGQGAGLSHQFH